MENQLLIHEMVEKELERLRSLHDQLIKELEHLPEGSLSSKDGAFYRSCVVENKQYMVKLGTCDNQLFSQLKKKRYIKKGLPILKKRIRTCERFIKSDILYDPVALEQSLPDQYQGLQELGIFLDDDINISEWEDTNTLHSSMYQNNQKHLTAHGYMTRSKSEALIGLRLAENDISFKYEPLLKLGRKRFAPDFEILLPARRLLVYWEHFGMLDDPAYVINMLKKLEEYAKHGIVLGYNLIITYETKDKPLTINDIDMKIKELLAMDKKYD